MPGGPAGAPRWGVRRLQFQPFTCGYSHKGGGPAWDSSVHSVRGCRAVSAPHIYGTPSTAHSGCGSVQAWPRVASGWGSSVSGRGFGFLAGVGYDIRGGRNVSLTPTANFYFGADGDVSDVSGTVPSVKHTVIDFGLGITFH